MKFASSILTCLMLFLPLTASADSVAPDTLVRAVTNEVLDIVRHDKDIQTGNTQKSIALVETKVLPHFDFDHMTRLAMARNWKATSTDQRKALTDEFRILLVRTYSKALNEYKTQTIDVKTAEIKPTDTDARVRTLINQPGTSKPITLDYYLEKLASGWKVYDIEVGGISLVTNYRDFFTSEIRKGGVDGLVKTLHDKNSEADRK